MERLIDFRTVDIHCARSTIAHLVLGETNETVTRIGDIQLHSHQISALARLRSSIDEFGGALLCDPVGTGKTYVALALIPDGVRALVVAPAILRDMWSKAATLATREVDFASFESLSRGHEPRRGFRFVIVDEAHHVRNRVTRRYGFLSRAVRDAQVLLLTATPVHNRVADLKSLLSLFLGTRADALTGAELSRCVIRRSHLIKSIAGIPAADSLVWFRIPEDSGIPTLLLALPPPTPPCDGGDGGALIANALIRQWASSDAALLGALQRRIVRAESLAAALEDGTWPSSSELSSWIAGEDTVQLGFSSLLSTPLPGTAVFAEQVRAHADGLRKIRHRARLATSDDERVELIRRIRSTHRGASIVAFSQYSDTVNSFFTKLSADGKVAVLTGTGARVAGGRLSRTEVIERFAPLASGRQAPRTAEAITLLLATDLLSEGLNLQDASVVIHLDLPWTPARMEQRLGRIARVGSRYERVNAYAIHPPVSADEITRIEEILQRKMEAAGVVSAEFHSLRGWAPPESGRGGAAIGEEIRAVLREWSVASGFEMIHPVAAAISSTSSGFLAAVVDRDRVRLITSIDGRISDDPAALLRSIQACNDEQRPVQLHEVFEADAAIRAFVHNENALESTRVSSVASRSARNRAMKRINEFSQTAKPHARAAAFARAEAVRRILGGNLNAQQETELEQIDFAGSADQKWIDAVMAIGGSRPPTERAIHRTPLARAVILFHP